MSNILTNNGFSIANLYVMAKSKYTLKAWVKNPSGSVIKKSYNFTSSVPTGTSGDVYSCLVTV